VTPWTLIDSARVPGDGAVLRLYQRGGDFSIRVGGRELMSSRAHGSEDALGDIVCRRIARRAHPRILIGGLGMGFTLAAALCVLDPHARVDVAELVPAVVTWNRGPLAGLAGNPLDDGRVTLRPVDVALILRSEPGSYDGILLDVDNGPEGLTHKANDWLYALDGLNAAFAALRRGGLLAVWSGGADAAFTQRLRKVGFEVEQVRVRGHGGARGARYLIWIAARSD